MADLIYLAIIIIIFLLCFGLIRFFDALSRGE